MTTIEKLRGFLADELKADVSGLSDDDTLLGSGILDSMAVMKLITFLEDNCNIEVSDEDFDPDNFESLNAINKLVESKLKG